MLPVARPETAIVAEQLTKVYRLYRRPGYRLMDLLGLCPQTAEYFTEHAALRDVTLQVERGQKVAIIGRNGAGKSTLLKLIAGVIRPTSGAVAVQGRISNLLQLGTGFHPEFTGRQNVYASLAHQGIAGREADRGFDEIVKFAEIAEYIDQPMKTYSTGMCSRLMFSASIVLKPDLLIVDEILGVGDAYFSHKSFERMRELCTQAHTTLLLVTHDIYSALNLCDRFIWIDRGQVKFDGDGKSAISLYESSVKEQEEHALRQQNAAKLADTSNAERLHVLFRTRTGFALTQPLALDRIELLFDPEGTSRLPVAEGAAGWDLLPEGTLGPPDVVAGSACRVMQTSGSIYHKAEWVTVVPKGASLHSVRLRWHFRGEEPVDLRVFTPDRRLLVAGTLTGGAGWQEALLTLSGDGPNELDAVKQSSYGTGVVRILSVEFIGPDGETVVEVRHRDPLVVRIHVSVDPALVDRRVTFVLGFSRPGSAYQAYVYRPSLVLGNGDRSVIDVAIESIALGSGQWYVNVGVGEAHLHDRANLKYFAISSSWYHLLAERLEIRVASLTKVDQSGCFVMHPGTVTVHDDPGEQSGEGAPPEVLAPSA